MLTNGFEQQERSTGDQRGIVDPPVGLVTLLFSDIEESTLLARAAGQGWGDVLADHHGVLRGAIGRHGGWVDATEGDSFFAVFVDPVAALHAAVEVQRELAVRSWPHGIEAVRVRMGLHTGWVERRDLGYVSLEVHRGARVAAAANGGQILLTQATRALLGTAVDAQDLGEHRLKDFPRPERLFHVVIDGRRADQFGSLRTARVRPTNLPAEFGPLIGRELELERVVELCELCGEGERFVTLVGSGGAGKTRLALAAARRQLDDLPNGAFVVSLAAVSDPAAVMPAIARVLGVRDVGGELEDGVAERLGGQAALLVLDNFEQILVAASLVGELVRRTAGLRVLVTSQAPLRVRGETVLPLGALTLDAAVELFCQRARAAVPGWSLREAERAEVCQVCERVGRTPLAVELAAARVLVLNPAELLARLERSAGLLRSAARDAPDRHRSLNATFAWTCGLLQPDQRTLFRRLGVFADAVPLDAIEAVTEDPGDAEPLVALEALEGLIEFSLVRREQLAAGGTGFGMPQALRHFAREELIASGEEAAVRRRHAEHISAVAQDARVWFSATPAQRARVLALDAELRPALAWTAEADRPFYRRLVAAAALHLSWTHLRELNEHAARAADPPDVPLDELGAWIGNCRAHALMISGRLGEAEAVLAPVIDFQRVHGDDRELGLALQNASWLASFRGEDAVGLARESLELVRRSGDTVLAQRGVMMLIRALTEAGRVDEAEKAVERDFATMPEPRSEHGLQLAAMRGDLALARGDSSAATECYVSSLRLAARLADEGTILPPPSLLHVAEGVVVALARGGHPEAALAAAGVAQAIADDAGKLGHARREYEETISMARAALGPDAEAAHRRGEHLSALERVDWIRAVAEGAVTAPDSHR